MRTGTRYRFRMGGLAAAALIVLGPGRSVDAVLCVGFDGHVEVEAALRGECWDGKSESSGQASVEAHFGGVKPATNNCGACLDIPLCGTGGETFRRAHDLTKVEVKTSVVKALASSSMPSAMRGDVYRACSQHAQVGEAIRVATTILRI